MSFVSFVSTLNQRPARPGVWDGAAFDAGVCGEGADAAAQAVHAAKPADALTTVLGSPAGATLRRVARDLDSTDLLIGLARRRTRPARSRPRVTGGRSSASCARSSSRAAARA